MSAHAVVIAGGGPTGLMLAGELALAGVDVAIVERRVNQEVDGSRAGGLHARTLEVLDQRGIVGRFLALGQVHRAVHFRKAMDIGDFPSRHNCSLALWQRHTERLLAEWVGELGVAVHRGCEVTGFAQDDAGVDVALSDGRSLRAAYLVGCDGGRSLVRKSAGIGFPGWEPTTSWLMAEVAMTEAPKWGFHENAFGIHAIGKAENTGKALARVVLTDRQLQRDANPTLHDVREALVAVYGTDFGAHAPTWISRFTDMTRQADAYRDRRVLLAGDAAHVHPPIGGQGLNLGVQDAVNLGWKLAQVVQRTSPESLLDTYHAERHPVAARVLRHTMAHVALRRTDDRTKALDETLSELLAMDEPRKPAGRGHLGPGRSLRPGRGAPAARAAHARSGPRHRRGAAADVHVAARGTAGAAQPRRAWRLRHRAVGGTGPAGRCKGRGRVGASGHRAGRGARCRADPARRPCGVGGRLDAAGVGRGPDRLVRTARRGVVPRGLC
jgi:3-(3-hydroxy-phenyl)propionate hydroxylase